MEKKYRLKKDTPECKAGDVFEWSGIYYINKQTESWYLKDIVESNPDWFEVIKEPEYPQGIVEFDSGYIQLTNPNGYQDWVEYCMDKGYKITRVKNSSGVEFKVGDEVMPPKNCGLFKIEDFLIEDANIWACHRNKRWRWNIDLLIIHATPRIFTEQQILDAIDKEKSYGVYGTDYNRIIAESHFIYRFKKHLSI